MVLLSKNGGRVDNDEGLESFASAWSNVLSIVRKTSVAFRSAKVAFFHSFAERKATIKDRTMLSDFNDKPQQSVSSMDESTIAIESATNPMCSASHIQGTSHVQRPKSSHSQRHCTDLWRIPKRDHLCIASIRKDASSSSR